MTFWSRRPFQFEKDLSHFAKALPIPDGVPVFAMDEEEYGPLEEFQQAFGGTGEIVSLDGKRALVLHGDDAARIITKLAERLERSGDKAKAKFFGRLKKSLAGWPERKANEDKLIAQVQKLLKFSNDRGKPMVCVSVEFHSADFDFDRAMQGGRGGPCRLT
jgi:hypothetical protein